MSKYTPTTEQMRDLYVRADPAGYKSRREYEAEFDRWLERTLQEARAEAWHEGYGHGRDDQEAETRTNQMHVTLNPYRKETT